MTRPSVPAAQSIAHLLRVPYRTLVTDLYERLAVAGYPELQPAHSSIFPYIRDGIGRGSELAARSGLTKQSVAYLVDSLESAGLVERTPDPEDGRAKIVRLTARGRAAERVAARIIQEIESEWAKSIGAADAAHLRTTLERLCAAIEPNGKPSGTNRLTD